MFNFLAIGSLDHATRGEVFEGLGLTVGFAFVFFGNLFSDGPFWALRAG
ncbi:hypothetical protein [Rhodoferax sp.]|nr:hypothetical protein [Rhodoferax sp.]MDD2926429.1 hypothetical protein [Rhodoferax sp.]